ncbi:hypothetical protein [Pseudoalteromonas denitrificans]|uniref:Uncharacterized protein n=1 Tax=Pseudoalteromonas denitrificans DSM 6059 TaxID=1123010 RepID=A0A1I1MBJ9_9GAMM|nr:hypothetical protein [Pseudoalteromonas denitrificans]SFC82771.1 hypothetical protein SAMN02745724_02650 [Pseudoalteromonas denitrificans DSM 6059]
MSEKSERVLKKQYKLLKKAIKTELKKSLKSSNCASNKLMALSQLDIEVLAKEVVTQALGSSEAAAKTQAIYTIEPKPSSMSFALKPCKKSPCKQCPALSGGLCQCAIKQHYKKQLISVS